MKVAIPTFAIRVSPRFDCVHSVPVATSDNGRAAESRDWPRECDHHERPFDEFDECSPSTCLWDVNFGTGIRAGGRLAAASELAITCPSPSLLRGILVVYNSRPRLTLSASEERNLLPRLRFGSA